jgi:hypothetical protein
MFMRLVLALLMLFLFVPSAAAQLYDGSWAGTTGQGKAISFTIASNAMPTIKFGGQTTSVGCNGSFTLTTNFTPARSVSTPSFVINGGVNAPGLTTWSLSGTFSSPTSVSGNLNFNTNAIPGVPGSCSGSGSTTWSATRSGGGGPPVGTLAGIIAVVGSTAGSGGSFFKTAVQLHNPGTSPITGKLVYHPAGSSGTDNDPALNYTLASRQTIAYDDLLPAMGLSGLGSLDLVTNTGAAPLTTFRIFNDAAEKGTSGLGIDPIPASEALQSGQTAVLLVPADLVRFRMNIGVRTLASGVSMMITVRDKDGLTRHTTTKSYGPTFFTQVSGASFADIVLTPNDSINIAINSGSAIIYGSVTDNTTQDPTLIYAKSIF